MLIGIRWGGFPRVGWCSPRKCIPLQGRHSKSPTLSGTKFAKPSTFTLIGTEIGQNGTLTILASMEVPHPQGRFLLENPSPMHVTISFLLKPPHILYSNQNTILYHHVVSNRPSNQPKLFSDSPSDLWSGIYLKVVKKWTKQYTSRMEIIWK